MLRIPRDTSQPLAQATAVGRKWLKSGLGRKVHSRNRRARHGAFQLERRAIFAFKFKLHGVHNLWSEPAQWTVTCRLARRRSPRADRGRPGVGGGVAGGAAGVPRPVAPTGPLSPSPPPNPRLALPSHTCGPSRPAGRRGTMTVGVTSQWSLEAAAAPASGGRQARSHPSRPVVPIRIPWKSYYILRICLKNIIG